MKSTTILALASVKPLGTAAPRAGAIPVMGPRHHRSPFVPNNLQHFPSVDRCVPDISRLDARDQRERRGPVGSGVPGNRGLRVALAALLQIARLRTSACIYPGAIAPFAIEGNSVRRVADREPRLTATQQPGDGVRVGRVSAEYPVRTTMPPQIADSTNGVTGYLRPMGGVNAGRQITAGGQSCDLYAPADYPRWTWHMDAPAPQVHISIPMLNARTLSGRFSSSHRN
jgi:hypothetical protein